RRMGSKRPVVSVVVPIFNKAPFLKACLDSISNQTLADLQVVCIDDASTDGSLDIAEEHACSDDRVIVLRQKINRGAGVARNRGLMAARASYVQFTDADDLLPPSALDSLYRLATEDSVPFVKGSLAVFRDHPDASWQEDAHALGDRHRIALTEE